LRASFSSHPRNKSMRSVAGKPRVEWLFATLFALVFPLFAGCLPARETPEMQVRALLKQAEVAAEARNLSVLRQLVSDHYTDSQGQDKRTIEATLRYYFLRNESIHLLTRVQAITFPEPSHARAVVLVAMAGEPIPGVQEIERLRADLYRFEITLANENKEWKAIRVEWRQAELGDFF
jgi:hypothetical protein